LPFLCFHCLVANTKETLAQLVLHLSVEWTLSKLVLSLAFKISFHAHASIP
jgi:hypothetical protein